MGRVKLPHVDAEDAEEGAENATAGTTAGTIATNTAAQVSADGTVKTAPVKTADNSPVIPYAGSAAVAGLLAMGLFLVRTKQDPDIR